nr:MAG TPA: hypothetical protein [Caudoviricetes sp.]
MPFGFLHSYKNVNGLLHIPSFPRGRKARSGVGRWGVLSPTKGNYFPFESLKPR